MEILITIDFALSSPTSNPSARAISSTLTIYLHWPWQLPFYSKHLLPLSSLNYVTLLTSLPVSIIHNPSSSQQPVIFVAVFFFFLNFRKALLQAMIAHIASLTTKKHVLKRKNAVSNSYTWNSLVLPCAPLARYSSPEREVRGTIVYMIGCCLVGFDIGFKKLVSICCRFSRSHYTIIHRSQNHRWIGKLSLSLLCQRKYRSFGFPSP